MTLGSKGSLGELVSGWSEEEEEDDDDDDEEFKEFVMMEFRVKTIGNFP